MHFTEEQQPIIDRVNELIYSGCNYKLEDLEAIYHEDLIIVMVMEDGTVVTLNKKENMEIFSTRLKENAPPLSMAVEFKHIDVKNGYANAIVVRHVDFFGKMNKIYFSLFLKKSGDIWKVYRENAFVVH